MDSATSLPASHFMLIPWPSCSSPFFLRALVFWEAWERKEYELRSHTDLGPVSDLMPICVTLINLRGPCSLCICEDGGEGGGSDDKHWLQVS